MFIARLAFDPASVCYAPRVAYGDPPAAWDERLSRNQGEIKEKEDEIKITFKHIYCNGNFVNIANSINIEEMKQH